MAKTTKTTKPDKISELNKKSPTDQAMEMVQENMIANIRDNFYDGNRILWLIGEISLEAQYDIIKWLHFFNDKSKKPVTIYINSLGGSIYTMNTIVDLINELKNNDIIVNTVCLGTAQSAGAMIFAAGSKGHRYIAPNAFVMIHSVQSFLGMEQVKTKDLSIQSKWIERIQTQTENMLAEFTGQPLKTIKKMTEYENYFSAEEAVNFGLADQIDTFIV